MTSLSPNFDTLEIPEFGAKFNGPEPGLDHR